MIRRTFMQAIGLSLFSPTVANDSKVIKYLDKNLIIVSEAEMREMGIKLRSLIIRFKIRDSDLVSEMKTFVDQCKRYNVPITTDIYGNLNKNGFAIIAESATWQRRQA